MKVTELKPGDACPACGGTFQPALVPSAEQRRRFEDHEIREPFPHHYDTASEAQRAELGALHRCDSCGYITRVPLEAAADKPARASRARAAEAPAGN
jgi:hypothetical protein